MACPVIPEQLIVQCASVIPSSVLHIDLLWEVWEKTPILHKSQDHLFSACNARNLTLTSSSLLGNMNPNPSFFFLTDITDA